MKNTFRKECGLTSLETRRLRADQIEVFKILNGHENIDTNIFFLLKKDSRTRGYEVTLVKDQSRLDIRKYSFSQRTINEWDKSSTYCVTANGFLVHLSSGPLPWVAILLKRTNVKDIVGHSISDQPRHVALILNFFFTN